MNILVPHSWLLDFLETKAKPKQIAQALSLHSASVESLDKLGEDYLYNLEITTNRIDMASVYGIAREAAAALLRLGIKAKLKKQFNNGTIGQWNNDSEYLKVKISKPSLCLRFSTVLYRVIEKGSPAWMKERLKKAGIRPVNNVVDVTNYVMLELGQPMHSFDFNKIKEEKSKKERVKTMILRESKKGEEIATLDGVKRVLFGGDIVIEDGGGRLIDLCGLMGGRNTAIDKNTKTVLLFAQTYDPARIRKTIQKTGLRTEAASRFEKGTDPELVLPALGRAYELLKQTANVKLIGGLVDIYPKPYKQKTVTLDFNLVERYLSLKISPKKIIRLLCSLGFKISNQLPVTNYQLPITIPSWRANDINIPQDLIEEIARLYGYHRLPNRLTIGSSVGVSSVSEQFFWIEKIKDFLKYQGFTEVYTSSFLAKELIQEVGFNPKKCLKLKNPLGKEGEYLRPSLLPGLLQVSKENKGRVGERSIKIFELSKVYLPKQAKQGSTLSKVEPSLRFNLERGRQPVEELLMLTGIVNTFNSQGFLEIKGVIKSLLQELGIKNYQISPSVDESCPIVKLLHPYRRAQITIEPSNHQTSEPCGLLGQINNTLIFDLDFGYLLKYANTSKTFQPIPQYPPIIEDLSFTFPAQTYVGPVIEEIKKTEMLISKVELVDTYQNTKTFRLYYQHPKKTLTDKEVKKTRNRIIQEVGKKFKAKAKSAKA